MKRKFRLDFPITFRHGYTKLSRFHNAFVNTLGSNALKLDLFNVYFIMFVSDKVAKNIDLGKEQNLDENLVFMHANRANLKAELS